MESDNGSGEAGELAEKGGDSMPAAKKTMYAAMNHLAAFLSTTEETNFDTAWEIWAKQYEPPSEMEPALKQLGKQLMLAGKEAIRAVPELKYRRIIKKTLKPEIEKEDKNG